MKAIILAGGSGTRLFPSTKIICKQLLPVYDKPMIYYPLSTIMLSGIKDVLIISTPHDIDSFKKLLNNGNNIGINISYAIQEKPEGIAQAFIIGKNFIGSDTVCLILGDNIFYGNNLSSTLQKATTLKNGAHIFGYYVNDPQRYGIVSFDENYKILSIEEKPKIPKSNYAVTGLYFYDNNVIKIAESLKPSNRNELEITDINNLYLQENKLKLTILERGLVWLDTGTHNALTDASYFVKIIEERQNLKIGCIEEIAYKMNYINKQQLLSLANQMLNSSYGEYLLTL